MNAPARYLHDAADKVLREDAIQNLTWRLHAGRTVGGLTIRDLIDGDLGGERSGFAIIEVTNLLLADSRERAAMADTYVSSVIERFLTTKPELVEEEMADMESTRGEEAAIGAALDRRAGIG